MRSLQSSRKSGFTLIEVLIVIGVLSVLSLASVLLIKPAEFLKQSRDVKRINDIKDISRTFQGYEASTGMGPTSDKVVYISLPDSSPTCSNHTLPPLKTGWSYACATTGNYRKLNTSGWIPRDFSAAPTTRFAMLPIDPINNVQHFYTYIPGRSLTAVMESVKGVNEYSAKDGGYDSARFEAGSNLKLWYQAVGLGLYNHWTFNDGSGTSAVDSHGGRNGVLTSSVSPPSLPSWQLSGCKSSGCLLFNGTSSFVRVDPFWTLLGDNYKGPITYAMWVKPNAGTVGSVISDNNDNEGYIRFNLSTNTVVFQFDSASRTMTLTNPTGWHFVALTSDPSKMTTYLDGATGSTNQGSCTGSCGPDAYLRIGGGSGLGYFNGYIDEVKIYNRVLTTSELDAIYHDGF